MDREWENDLNRVLPGGRSMRASDVLCEYDAVIKTLDVLIALSQLEQAAEQRKEGE